ncbi:MAG: type I glyceraldehyde-3-phosphate dehydrogenase [Epsilonproteobacteria bacterium]|nr:type I glyceraldehyde-3-phosphate dehydrogenase [Campylobacterota bacterium]NPA56816.1 type I glyceraldehyde-3-phosphate dehydrogenase [Campylobacterota bacterium]
MVEIAINGFGRIGRALFREAFRRGDVQVVAINDLMAPEMAAYLLKFDSVHGEFEGEVIPRERSLIVEGREIRYSRFDHPSSIDLPRVDLVIEATGRFTNSRESEGHLRYGEKVIISAPATDETPTYVYGINHLDYRGERIISNASCTTNALAPIAKAIDEAFGIERAFMTTIHSYTIDQNLLDSDHRRDRRRARAAAVNIIPTTTGAAKAIYKVLPSLKGRFDGRSVRVPVADVSLMDLAIVVKRETTLQEVDRVLRQAASALPQILAIDDSYRVSSDLLGSPFSSVVAGDLTQIIGKNFIKVMSWYDNEYGYANRLLDMAKFISKGE